MSDQIEAQAAAANQQMEQLKADYAKSPDGRAAAARERLSQIHEDPYRQSEAQSLQAELQRAEQDAVAMATALSDGARIDNALAGIVERGPQVTFGDQISQPDLVDAVTGLVRHGVRDDAVKSFLETGQLAVEDRQGQIALAQQWLSRLMNNEGGLRDKLLAGDAETKRAFDYFAMYAPSKAERTDEYDRVAAGMPAW